MKPPPYIYGYMYNACKVETMCVCVRTRYLPIICPLYIYINHMGRLNGKKIAQYIYARKLCDFANFQRKFKNHVKILSTLTKSSEFALVLNVHIRYLLGAFKRSSSI